MARFIENITEIKRGYDNDSFIAFLQDEDNKFPWEYHCIKLDLPDNRVNEKIFCELLDIKKDDKWLITHNTEYFPWLPFEKYNYLVPTLRDFFKEHNIDNKFEGGFEVSTSELKSLALDIVSYSSVLEYIDINVSSLCDPVVFKLCGHGDINIISHDKKMISFLLEQIKIDVKYKVVIY